MTLLIVILLGSGILLLYSAVTGKNPVDVVKGAIGGSQ